MVAIEGTWGLGSALVAGEVTPDSFTVSKVTGEITGRRVRAKLRAHSFMPNGQGISARPMPPALRRSPCLTDDEARALALVGRQVEEHYGMPQDIEWALLGDSPGDPALHADPADRIVLLQSRPETVWAARDRAPDRHPQAPRQRPRARPVQEGPVMDLTNEDVADILALLDSLPYDELDLETSRFRLTLRRTPAGWTQSTQILSAPGHRPPPHPPTRRTRRSMTHRAGHSRHQWSIEPADASAEGSWDG